MFDLLKKKLEPLCFFIGPASFGMFFYKMNIPISNWYVLIYFIAVFLSCFIIYGSKEASIENAISETLELFIILILPLDLRFKLFLLGGFIHISLNLLLLRSEDNETINKILKVILWICIFGCFGFVLINHPNFYTTLQNIEKIEPSTWLLIGMCSLIP